MANNKTKIDRLHDLMPAFFNTKHNPNWHALIEALGQADQDTANLVEEVRKQFFVQTASRPYLDRLGSNMKVARPRFVGMDDSTYRNYIPVLSYKPKQVKLIIDALLDIFFFKESTTAYITSQTIAPFPFEDGWDLEYIVDEAFDERIVFHANEFTSIGAASANEIVAAINRQAQYSYATTYYDSPTKNTYIRIFTNTIGAKGSLRMVGGRANIALRLNGFIDTAGNSSNAQWTVTKVGDSVSFRYIAGNSPGIENLQIGDIALINLPSNKGSFSLTDVDVFNGIIYFTNVFATAGTFAQTSNTDIKFIRPSKYAAYLNDKRAMTWETKTGEIEVEMPASPPVVRRSLKGSIHINGPTAKIISRISDTSVILNDARNFPISGNFWIERKNQIDYRIVTLSENLTDNATYNGRLIHQLQKYSYSDRTVLSTTADIAIGSKQLLNVGNVVGVAPGQTVFMLGVPVYAYVVSVSGNTVNISNAATSAGVSIAVVFGGNTITGISPALPLASNLNELTISTLSRLSGVVSGVTASAHGYNTNDSIIVTGCSGIPSCSITGDTVSGSSTVSNISSMNTLAPGQILSGAGIDADTYIDNIVGNAIVMTKPATSTAIGTLIDVNENLNGCFPLTSASNNSFSFQLLGLNGAASIPGTIRAEKEGLGDNSKIFLTNAVSADASRIKGPYLWDINAPFVLSSFTASTLDNVEAGTIQRILNIGTNSLPSTGGDLIFNYGLNNQEGPVRYLFKPSDSTVILDPSYTFKKTHQAGSNIVALRHKGPHVMSVNGAEYAPYVIDPADARLILEDLIRSVKSAGIFVNFIVRYPEQLYGLLDVYHSGTT